MLRTVWETDQYVMKLAIFLCGNLLAAFLDIRRVFLVTIVLI